MIKNKDCAFFSASVDKMLSPIHSGGRDLHSEPEEEITKAILEPLFAYLTSNREVDLSSGLEIKTSVMSIAHTAEYDEKKKKRTLKRAPPEGHLVGHRGASLKEINQHSGSCYGFIIVPPGIPAQKWSIQENLFVSYASRLCLATAATVFVPKESAVFFVVERGSSQEIGMTH